MIGYVTVGTNDFARAAKFYDELFTEIEGKRMMEMDRFIAWSNGPGAAFSITKPFDEKPATVGNGVMVALAMEAIALGATDEGKPGPRGDNFYAGYFRDLDGNKLNAFFMG